MNQADKDRVNATVRRLAAAKSQGKPVTLTKHEADDVAAHVADLRNCLDDLLRVIGPTTRDTVNEIRAHVAGFK